MLRKHPGASAIAVFALALGIGLTTMMFSIVYGALVRGLPFEDQQNIVTLARANPSRGIERMGVTIHDYVDWREQQRSFEHLAAYYTGTVNVAGTEGVERFDGAFVTPQFFSILRVRPQLGRSFLPEEEGPHAPHVALISHRTWQDRYGGDAAVVGRVIRANGQPTTIVGVMPEGFLFPYQQHIWVPLRLDAVGMPRGEGLQATVMGRLRPGVTIELATADVGGIAARLADAHPATNEGVTANVRLMVDDFIGDEPRALLMTMLAAVIFVLLIACANVANLLLGRAAVRIKEMGVRTALGASRRRIVLLFLGESFALSSCGAILGLGLGWAGVRLFVRAIEDSNPPYWLDFSIDGPIILFVLGMTMLATLVAGGLPALQASRTDVSEILKDESRGSSSMRIGRMSKGLVIAEMALSCALLVGAGLSARSVTKLNSIDFGFPTEEVFTARVGLPEADYPEAADQVRYYEQLQQRLAGIPGVAAAALTTNLPGLGSGLFRFAREGESYAGEQDHPQARRVVATPGLFETFRKAVAQGRDLTWQDGDGSLPVALVNRSFAARYFPAEEPLGARIRIGTAESEEPWLTIVGLVPDMYAGGVSNENPETIYLPYAQVGGRFLSIAARTRGNPLGITSAVREAVASLDSDMPIYWVEPLSRAIANQTWFYRIFGGLFMLFGFAALFLAGVGLYGVMSFSVSRRTRELGVRMAIGAGSGDVLRLIMRQGLKQLAVGMVLGIGLALATAHLLRFVLFDVDPRDPVVFASIVLVLTGATVLACYVPANRATRVDPLEALRHE